MRLIEQCEGTGVRVPEPGSDKRTAEILDQLRQKDLSAEVLSGLIESLGHKCDRSAVEPLAGLLGHPSEQVRLAVILALGRLGDPSAVEQLAVIVNAESPRVRQAIARTLLSITRGPARNVALNYIASPAPEVKDEDDMRLRGSVILTLNELTNPVFNRKSITFLYSYTQSPSPKIVRIAEEVITRLPATRNGSRELIGILKHSNTPQVRVWVCSWLGRLRITEGREVLIETAEKDISQPVRTAAAEALKLLGS